MGFLRGLLSFGAGSVVGALIGATAASLLAPQNGEELQQKIVERREESSAAKARAEVETAAQMRQLFRAKVQDPNALRDDVLDAGSQPDLLRS